MMMNFYSLYCIKLCSYTCLENVSAVCIRVRFDIIYPQLIYAFYIIMYCIDCIVHPENLKIIFKCPNSNSTTFCNTFF